MLEKPFMIDQRQTSNAIWQYWGHAEDPCSRPVLGYRAASYIWECKYLYRFSIDQISEPLQARDYVRS